MRSSGLQCAMPPRCKGQSSCPLLTVCPRRVDNANFVDSASLTFVTCDSETENL